MTAGYHSESMTAGYHSPHLSNVKRVATTSPLLLPYLSSGGSSSDDDHSSSPIHHSPYKTKGSVPVSSLDIGLAALEAGLSQAGLAKQKVSLRITSILYPLVCEFLLPCIESRPSRVVTIVLLQGGQTLNPNFESHLNPDPLPSLI